MAPHSSTLAWKIPGVEEPGRGVQEPWSPWGRKESDRTESLLFTNLVSGGPPNLDEPL